MSEQYEPDDSSPGHSRLCDFMREHHALILERWAQQVHTLPSARELSLPQLMDHLPELLERMACAMDRRRGGSDCALEEAPVVHALTRLDAGYNLEEVVGEYTLLRACILQLYGEHLGAIPQRIESMAEVERFNRLFDETVAVAVSRYARARERALAALDHITQEALGTDDLDTLLPRLLRALQETTESVDLVTLLLREGDTLRVRASVGLEEEVAARYSVRVGEGFSGTIAARRSPMELHEASEDPLVKSPAIRHRGVLALYGVPLLEGSQVIGVAHMGSRTAQEFSEEDKLLFRTMAGRATSLILQAQALERERAAREELATREQLLRLVIEQSGDAILMADEHGVLRIFNEEAERQHGVVRQQVTAAEWSTTYGLLSPEGRPLPLEETPLYRALHGERVVGARWLVRRPDGQVRLLSGTASPLRRPDGSPAGAVLISRDETERLEQEQVLRQTAEFRERFLGKLCPMTCATRWGPYCCPRARCCARRG
jgi:PAS domain S-box-containing protein